MRQLILTLYLYGVRLHTCLEEAIRRRSKLDPERGSVTIEQVAWAVAVIAIVAIAYAAIKAYVTAQAAKLG